MQFEKKSKSSIFKKLFSLMGVALFVAGICAVGTITISRYNTFKNSLQVPKSDDITSSETSDTKTPKSENKVVIPAPEETNENKTSTATTTDNVPYEQPQEKTVTFIMPVDGTITKPYSDSALQYSETFGDMRLHEGIDIKCEEGTAVLSACDGIVKEVTEDASMGRIVIIENEDGSIIKYCGLKDISVKSGQKVVSGAAIGTSGNPPFESADDPHIHIEAEKGGKTVSPVEAFGF